MTKTAKTKRHCTKKEQEERTQHPTDLGNRLEDHTGKADGQFNGFHIGELQQQGLVLGCVAQVSISLCEESLCFKPHEQHLCLFSYMLILQHCIWFDFRITLICTWYLDPTLVQSPVGLEQPAFSLFPPQGMIWPVLRSLCRETVK